MLVHFPIALLLWGFIADVASMLFKKEACLSKVGFYLLLIGALTTLSAVLSGFLFTSEMQGAAGELKENHELFAKITMFVMLAATVIRLYYSYMKKDETKFKWLVFCLYGIAMITVGITGYLGGTLVYNYMMPL